MAQDIARLGSGTTNARPMAALEGIVAALEVRATPAQSSHRS